MLNKVPEITVVFWVIKILCTTVGETFADLLNDKLGLGLTLTTYVMGTFLALMLIVQFTYRRYVPSVYWTVVVLLSVVGTLITDNMTDNFGIPLATSTLLFAAALTVTFVVWYAVEGTLSIHSITSIRREVFYWLTILFTFALGTAAGDLVGEKFGLGYLWSVVLWGSLITVIAVAHSRFALNAVLAFWSAYVLTRPLGASIGDLLSQKPVDGGLGLGILKISVVFLLTIAALVGYLTRTRADVTEYHLSPEDDALLDQQDATTVPTPRAS